MALVTGASKGLGKALAVGLAKAGADLALCARNRNDLELAREALIEYGSRAEIFSLDVLDAASVQQTAADVLEAFGRIDILVNNAGVNIRKQVLELTVADWDQVLDTNLKGYFLVAQAVVPAMIKQKKGQGDQHGLHLRDRGIGKPAALRLQQRRGDSNDQSDGPGMGPPWDPGERYRAHVF